MTNLQQQIEESSRNSRRELLIRRVLHELRDTIQLRGMMPDTPVDDVRADFTSASAEIVGVLVEAVDILKAIMYASDGCVGHRQCAHSMEPWQRARALLAGKWEADAGERRAWSGRA